MSQPPPQASAQTADGRKSKGLDEQEAVGRSAAAKETEFVGGPGASEQVPVVEVREPGELPEEVEGWLERVEHDDVEEPETVVHKGKVLVSPISPKNVSLSLPLTEDEVKQGLSGKVISSIRWLAEWCLRIIKKYHGRVAYKLEGKK